MKNSRTHLKLIRNRLVSKSQAIDFQIIDLRGMDGEDQSI
jgi:hypothetical protein